ncbi:MAG: hypothetical protein LBD65_06660 [Spirochaetaceae bacterium]|jgi:hypothetical protein|nr:hypothetical protein [Spirochaetaceae bacterium]
MKKKKLSGVFLGFMCMTLVLISCKSSPQTQSLKIKDENIPEWINDFPPDDVLWGIGSSKSSIDTLAMETAELRARQDISRQLTVITDGLIETFAQEAGSTDTQAALEYKQSVGRGLTSANLTGAVPVKRWRSPDGTWWYQIQMSKADAAKVASGIVENEASLYAQFKAQNALQKMDDLLAKKKSAPIVITDTNAAP